MNKLIWIVFTGQETSPIIVRILKTKEEFNKFNPRKNEWVEAFEITEQSSS